MAARRMSYTCRRFASSWYRSLQYDLIEVDERGTEVTLAVLNFRYPT
jgi:hypothetical protein